MTDSKVRLGYTKRKGLRCKNVEKKGEQRGNRELSEKVRKKLEEIVVIPSGLEPLISTEILKQKGDILLQAALILLQGQNIVGLGSQNLSGDFLLTADGILSDLGDEPHAVSCAPATHIPDRPCPPFNMHTRAHKKKCPLFANISSKTLSTHRQRLLIDHCRPLCVKTLFPSRHSPASHSPGGTPYGASVKRDVAAFRGQVCPPSVLNCACLPHSHRNISAAWLAASHISR